MTIHEVSNPQELARAAAMVAPGDRIRIAAGLYAEPVTITGCGDPAGPPIVIEPADDGWIRGGRTPDPPGSTPAPNSIRPATRATTTSPSSASSIAGRSWSTG